jgi:hypothetical protein
MKTTLKKLGLSLAIYRRGTGIESQGKAIRAKQKIRWHIADNLRAKPIGTGNRARRRIASLGILTGYDLTKGVF